MGMGKDTFDPKKKNAAGRVFSLVRMVNGTQEKKTIKGLNGYLLQGRRLQVNPAH